MALLHFLAAERARTARPASLAAAHVNHGLRGEDAEADAALVRAQAGALRLPIFEAALPPGSLSAARGEPSTTGTAPEDAARRGRYEALRGLAERADAACVATAHTADDQAETVLFRMARGAGLRGLRGMPAKGRVLGVRVVRPFLDVTREQVLDYLARHRIPYRLDTTNESLAPARNLIRLEILPRLKARVNAGIRSALLREAALFREADEYLEAEAHRHLERVVVERSQSKILLDATRLLDYPKLLRSYLFRCAVLELNGAIRDFTTAHIDALHSLVTLSSRRSADLPLGLVARRERGRIVLTRRLREPRQTKRPSKC